MVSGFSLSVKEDEGVDEDVTELVVYAIEVGIDCLVGVDWV